MDWKAEEEIFLEWESFLSLENLVGTRVDDAGLGLKGTGARP